MKFIDNQPVLNVIEKKPIGLLIMLDDEVKLPEGGDSTWLRKSEERHCEDSTFFQDRKDPVNFTIQHYAGPVVYQVAATHQNHLPS